MNDYETILLEVASNGLARLTLNRPEDRNLMSQTMVREIQHALATVHRDPLIRALLLSATGKTFCPGIGFDKGSSRGPKRPSALRIDTSIPYLLYSAPMPTIAAVNGACARRGAGPRLRL